ncbi:hypothetical protein D9M68_753150 [compost metagenome]
MNSFSAKPFPRSSMETIIASQNTTAVESALGREWMISYSGWVLSESRPSLVFWYRPSGSVEIVSAISRAQAQTAESFSTEHSLTAWPATLVPKLFQKASSVRPTGTPSQFSKAALSRPGFLGVFFIR